MNRKLYPLLAFVLLLSLALAACGGGGDGDTEPTEPPSEPASTGDVDRGKELYDTSCSACHGPNAEGVEGLGKSWYDSEFIQSRSDQELLTFINEGRPASDPENTTGVDMPPKGGNPSLTDEEILDIIAYMRSLQ